MKRKTVFMSIACSLVIFGSCQQTLQAEQIGGYQDVWVKIEDSGQVRKINYLEAILDGKILPKEYIGKTLGGEKDDIRTVKDGIGVVVLSLDFDKMNGDTQKGIALLSKLKAKYVQKYDENAIYGESIWDFIKRTGDRYDKEELENALNMLKNLTDLLDLEPDDTCENGFINSTYGTIICRDKQLTKLTKGWQNLKNIQLLDLRNNKLPNVDNLNGLTESGDVKLNENPYLTDISGLKNIINVTGKIYLDKKNYIVKIPASAKLCSTHLLNNIYLVDIDGSTIQIDPQEKYNTVCQYLTDNGNVQPLNDCETGYSGIQQKDIYCNNMGLKKLSSGWKHLIECPDLHLENNEITSLDNLSNLTRVWDLTFDYEKITNFDGLSSLTQLHSLTIQNNAYIENVNFLSNLRYAFFLDLSNNPNLKNVNGLSSLKEIASGTLNVGFNKSLTDISGLKNLTGFETGLIYLDKRNYTVKLPAYTKLCATQALNNNIRVIINGQIQNIDPNEKYNTICERLLDDGNIQPQNNCETGFSVGGYFQIIECQNMGLERLSSGWKHLTESVSINLQNNKINSLSNLTGLTKVETLLIDSEKITDFSGLANLTEIVYLSISGNPYIENLDFLTNLRKPIKSLDISHNQNLKNINGLSFLTTALGTTGSTSNWVGSIICNFNPNLTDISGLKNFTYVPSIYLDDKNYTKKLPATSFICATYGGLHKISLTQNDGTIQKIDTYKKYNTICERLVDNGNVQPGNNCETGYDGYYSYIICNDMGLERLSSGWLYTTQAQVIRLNDNPLSDIFNLKNITSINTLYLDNKEYSNKLPNDSWLCNDGFSKIKVVNKDGSIEDPVKSNICQI